MSLLLIVALATLAVLAAVGFGPSALARVRARATGRRRRPRRPAVRWDPGRELRAERRARELLRDAVGEEGFAMYEELGFVRVLGGTRPGGAPTHAYLIYPHRPIVSYDPATGELLSEHCVQFLDPSEPAYGERLPDADDVLAKWMTLTADERGLISDANVHLPGRQIDPAQVRRDLHRLRAWEGARGSGTASAGRSAPLASTTAIGSR